MIPFCSLSRKDEEKNALAYSREDNSEFWKPQKVNWTVVNTVKCIAALREMCSLLDALFCQQRKENVNCKCPNCLGSECRQRRLTLRHLFSAKLHHLVAARLVTKVLLYSKYLLSIILNLLELYLKTPNSSYHGEAILELIGLLHSIV